MRRVVLLAILILVCAGQARADVTRFEWPLRPPSVVRVFDAPRPDWRPGHRGVDLAGSSGQPVLAAGPGTVVFAGRVAGKQVVSIAHPGGLHTSYEPVQPQVGAGQRVNGGDVIGRLLPEHPGCAVTACLHWGAMWGPASAADYVDPLGLLSSMPIRLKPAQR